MERFRLIQDDDCHWYIIPADKVDEFTEWEKSISDEFWNVDFSPNYEDFRISGNPSNITFENPKED